MSLDLNRHNRRSLRAPEFDYAAPGAYFVTICTYGREALFGEVVGEEVRLNRLGEIVDECWNAIPMHFSTVEIDAFVIMPNHLHGIIVFNGTDSGTAKAVPVGATHGSPLRKTSSPDRNKISNVDVLPRGPKPGSLGAVIGQYKSSVSRRAKRELELGRIWQRNYYEHVIRDGDDWDRIRRCIETNPINWIGDENHPDRIM